MSKQVYEEKSLKEGKPDFKDIRSKVKKKFRGKGKAFKSSKQSRVNTGKQYNDTSWYMKNPTITEAFAKLPFNYIVGNPLAGMSQGYGSIDVPAIVSFNVDWVGSARCSTKVDAAEVVQGKNLIDLVATIVYTRMRRANAGSTNNIEHVDVIISNLLASIDIYCNVHYIHRIFRTANTFSWKNRSIPIDIFSDHWNLDYQDFIANQANYRGRFDTLIAVAQTIRTLANFPFIEAAKAQFTEIFKDTDTETGREQIIVSAKPFHHIYDSTGNSAIPGGMVRLMQTKDVKGWKENYSTPNHVVYTGTPLTAQFDTKKYTLGNLLDILEAQIYALVNDADFNLIQADIEKAFGEQSGYIVVDPVREVDPITPVYSGEFMTSFHNGTFWSLLTGYQLANTSQFKAFRAGTVTNTMYQVHNDETQVVEAAQDFGYFVSSGDHLPFNPSSPLLIDLESDDPKVEDIIVATRYKNIFKSVSKNNITANGWLVRHPLDSSIPDSALLLYSVASSNFMVWGGNITAYATSGLASVKTVYRNWTNVANVSYNFLLFAIEQHPLKIDGGLILGEVNNIRVVTPEELLPIQEACFLSLWNVPEQTNI